MIEKVKDEECELRSCPFCGGKAVMYMMRHDNGLFQGYYVTCLTKKCGMTIHTELCDEMYEAAEIWNYRYHIARAWDLLLSQR